MENDLPLVIRLAFLGAFFITLLAGVYLVKNDRKLFGPMADIPSENEGARAYNKMQVYAIWAHAVFLTGAFALFLH